MDLHLQYTSVGNVRSLAPTNNLPGGSIFSSIAGTTTDYIFPQKPQTIIKEGASKIHLFFSVTGRVSVTPVLIVKVPTPGSNPVTYTETVINPGGSETKNTTLNQIGVIMGWDFTIPDSYTLEDSSLILRLFIVDLRADAGNPSSMTIDPSSRLITNIHEGEKQFVSLGSTAKFTLFQKTERLFAWVGVSARESIDIPIYSIVKNNEEVFLDFYSNVNVRESVSYPIGIQTNPKGPYNVQTNYIAGLEIGDYVLPDWGTFEGTTPPGGATQEWYSGLNRNYQLRKKSSLHEVVEELGDPPAIIVPPIPNSDSEEEKTIEVAANRIADTFEMLKAEFEPDDQGGDDDDVPGDQFRVFMAGPLYGGTIDYLNKEWQLPVGFTAQNYSLQLNLEPKVVNQDISTTPVDVVSSSTLWLVLRHKPVGAELNAMHSQRPGRVVLRKEVRSGEEIVVWMWVSVSKPFIVDLYARNDYLQRPGFSASSAALMIG